MTNLEKKKERKIQTLVSQASCSISHLSFIFIPTFNLLDKFQCQKSAIPILQALLCWMKITCSRVLSTHHSLRQGGQSCLLPGMCTLGSQVMVTFVSWPHCLLRAQLTNLEEPFQPEIIKTLTADHVQMLNYKYFTKQIVQAQLCIYLGNTVAQVHTQNSAWHIVGTQYIFF